MVEINRTATFQAAVDVKWILADNEPSTPPTGYERFAAFDIPLGALGTLWAFKKA